MKIAADGKPIFEVVQCWNCHGEKTVQRFEPCKNAGQIFRKGCPICGKTRKAHHAYFPKPNRDTCETCKGEGSYVETRYDNDKSEFWHTLPIKVYRVNRRMSQYEELLGVGFGTVIDYGRHKSKTDEELIADVRKSFKTPQYCKYVTEAGRVADAIGIVCSDNGYSIVPHFEPR